MGSQQEINISLEPNVNNLSRQFIAEIEYISPISSHCWREEEGKKNLGQMKPFFITEISLECVIKN
jgi:hypothetical protein